MTYTLHSDPGHAWLEVTLKEIFELGIADKITEYSYMSSSKVYLEEDCDLFTFMKAKGVAKFDELDAKVSRCKRESPVRYMGRYNYNRAKEVTK